MKIVGQFSFNMKNNTNILIIITWVILLGAVSVLLNDIREFDYRQFENFKNCAKNANKNESWFSSKNAIEWSFYIINAGIFFWRGYLIYGFSFLLSVLKELVQGNYFSDKNIKYFNKFS